MFTIWTRGVLPSCIRTSSQLFKEAPLWQEQSFRLLKFPSPQRRKWKKAPDNVPCLIYYYNRQVSNLVRRLSPGEGRAVGVLGGTDKSCARSQVITSLKKFHNAFWVFRHSIDLVQRRNEINGQWFTKFHPQNWNVFDLSKIVMQFC